MDNREWLKLNLRRDCFLEDNVIDLMEQLVESCEERFRQNGDGLTDYDINALRSTAYILQTYYLKRYEAERKNAAKRLGVEMSKYNVPQDQSKYEDLAQRAVELVGSEQQRRTKYPYQRYEELTRKIARKEELTKEEEKEFSEISRFLTEEH